MKSIKIIMYCLIIVTLMGCVTRYTKPNFNQSQFEQDKAECFYEADKATIGTFGFDIGRLVDQCMKIRGYRIE